MPSLEDILKKTKAKSEQITTIRKPPSIATEDRPYSLADSVSIQLIETSNKVATNRQQTGNKAETNWQQSGNKVETMSQQDVNNLGIKKENWQQSGNQTGNTIGNKVATKWQQTDNKLATKTVFSELVGLQRDIILFICHECKNSRSRITERFNFRAYSNTAKT